MQDLLDVVQPCAWEVLAARLLLLLQVLIGAPCSNKVDMYSFGVIMWELITGEQPRRGMLRDIRYLLDLQSKYW